MKPLPSTSAGDPSSEELQGVLDASVDGIVIIDHGGRIEHFSRAAEQLFGYRSSEVLGQNVNVLMPDPDRSAHDGHLRRYVISRVPHIIGKGREVIARRKDGSLFPAQLSVGTVPHSEPPRFVGFIQDVTQRRRDEENALKLQERLTHVARLATIGEMASGIAHELNQPLAAMATFAHACDRLLGLPQPDIAEVQLALREIATQAVRAGDIIRHMRSLARADDLHRGAADINSVIVELTDLIAPDARAQGVVYRLELAAGLPLVAIDKGRIQQVVMNLARNALEAFAPNQPASREIVVSTRCCARGDLEIRVCDNGPGISEAIADRMFDPFCSTKPAGTGLGLAISRTIVAAHGGTLVHRPNEPTGACFIVALPPAPSGET